MQKNRLISKFYVLARLKSFVKNSRKQLRFSQLHPPDSINKGIGQSIKKGLAQEGTRDWGLGASEGDRQID